MNIKTAINKTAEEIKSFRSSASESLKKFWKPEKVYIIPNLFAVIWAGSSLYMYILYFLSANIAVLVLSVFMTAFWIFDMLYTNTLCKQLSLHLQNADFTADVPSEVSIKLENFQELQSVEIFSEGHTAEPKVFFFSPERQKSADPKNLSIPVKVSARTHLRRIRFRLSIRSVIGFFICWKYTDVSCDIHIWPKSVLHLESSQVRNLEDLSAKGSFLQGNEDFYEYKNYAEGESPSRIDWKVFAKRNQKLSKHFSAEGRPFQFIDWNNLSPSLSFEDRMETARALLELYMEKGRICFLKIPVRKEDISVKNRLDLAETLNLFSEASEEEWRNKG